MPLPGNLYIISGPAGTGKDTLLSLVLPQLPNLIKSVSVTTRPPGPGETAGVSYQFVSPQEFDRLRRQGELLESASVHDYEYGTPARWVREQRAAGRDVILNIDVQGALAIRQRHPEARLVFVMPPGPDPIATLKLRLTERGRNTPEDIETRLRNAASEMALADQYDLVVVNSRAEQAAQEIVTYIKSQRQNGK